MYRRLLACEEPALRRLRHELDVRAAEKRPRSVDAGEREQEHRLAQLRRCAAEQVLGEEPVQIVGRQAALDVHAAAHRGEPDHRRPPACFRDDHVATATAEDLPGLIVRERERVHLDDRRLAVDDAPCRQPARAFAARDQQPELGQPDELLDESLRIRRGQRMVVVVDDEQPVAAGRSAAHRLREAAGVVPARGEDPDALDHVGTRRLAHLREHLRQPDGKPGHVDHRRPARVPADPVLLARPLARQRRLSVSRGREEQRDTSPGLIQEPRQPGTLDDDLRPGLVSDHALVHRACLAAARRGCCPLACSPLPPDSGRPPRPWKGGAAPGHEGPGAVRR